jgi:hypothetical protein
MPCEQEATNDWATGLAEAVRVAFKFESRTGSLAMSGSTAGVCPTTLTPSNHATKLL